MITLTTRRTWTKILVAAVLLVPLMGADGGCEEKGRAPNTGEGQVDHRKSVTVQMTGKGRTRDGKSAAYHVTLRIRNTETDQVQTVRKDLVGDRFQYNIDYNKGTRIEIRFKVYGGANDVFDCKIYDGPGNVSQDHGLAQAYCDLYTAR